MHVCKLKSAICYVQTLGNRPTVQGCTKKARQLWARQREGEDRVVSDVGEGAGNVRHANNGLKPSRSVFHRGIIRNPTCTRPRGF